MSTIAVEAGGYDTASQALLRGNESAAAIYDSLTGKLAGFHALGGDDTSSEDFVKQYDGAAAEAVTALAALVEGLGNLSVATSTSAANHRQANAGSVYGRSVPAGDGAAPSKPRTVPAFTPPTSLGGDNDDLPDWWNHIVDHLQGWGWPSANTDQLRSAASQWRSSGNAVRNITGLLDDARGGLAHQRSPEIATATGIIATTRANVEELATHFAALGDACEDYASQVDQTRETIKGLLKDLAIECGVTAGVSVALSFVTFGGAAAVGAGVIAARAIRYAHLVMAALRGLRAARAVGTIASATPRLLRVRSALEKLRRARKIVQTYKKAAKGKQIAKEGLNAKQARNLTRYRRKLPSAGKGEETVIRDLGDGTVSYTTKVPGRVPGSYAEYTKIVDEAGETVNVVKTTYTPEGKIPHIKDKFN